MKSFHLKCFHSFDSLSRYLVQTVRLTGNIYKDHARYCIELPAQFEQSVKKMYFNPNTRHQGKTDQLYICKWREDGIIYLGCLPVLQFFVYNDTAVLPIFEGRTKE